MTARDLPTAVRALLRVTLPSDWCDDIQRDLQESWTTQRAERGPLRALLWLSLHTLLFSARFAPDRFRDLWGQSAGTSPDLKLAVRSTARSPWITALSVGALSVGIGAAVGGFSVIAGVFYTGLPFDGKIRPGIDLRTARAELTAIARPDPTQVSPDPDVTHLVTGLARPATGDTRELLLAVPILVLTLLLLVMATNVATLILARNATRQSELAIRGALGASRARIVGQLALEGAVLVALVTGVGISLSR